MLSESGIAGSISKQALGLSSDLQSVVKHQNLDLPMESPSPTASQAILTSLSGNLATYLQTGLNAPLLKSPGMKGSYIKQSQLQKMKETKKKKEEPEPSAAPTTIGAESLPTDTQVAFNITKVINKEITKRIGAPPMKQSPSQHLLKLMSPVADGKSGKWETLKDEIKKRSIRKVNLPDSYQFDRYGTLRR